MSAIPESGHTAAFALAFAARSPHTNPRARGDIIRTEDLPDSLLEPELPVVATANDAAGSLEELERRHIQQVLTEAATLEEAAARLGMNPTTLWRKRKRYGIE